MCVCLVYTFSTCSFFVYYYFDTNGKRAAMKDKQSMFACVHVNSLSILVFRTSSHVIPLHSIDHFPSTATFAFFHIAFAPMYVYVCFQFSYKNDKNSIISFNICIGYCFPIQFLFYLN